MTSNEESVTTWIASLKAGQSDAAGKIWHRYVERLVRLACRKLGNVRKTSSDEEDVVLSAFNGFLDGLKDGRFSDLDDRDDLWQILVMLTERRAIATRRHETRAKRGGGKVRGESVFKGAEDASFVNRGLDQFPGNVDTPDFALEMADELQNRLKGLSLVQRTIALGKLEGKTNAELAKELDISPRSVDRKLRLIKDIWEDNDE